MVWCGACINYCSVGLECSEIHIRFTIWTCVYYIYLNLYAYLKILKQATII